jgi:hypothetical protein
LKHLTEKTLAENINRLFMFISLPYPSVWETWEKAAKAKEMLFFIFSLNLIKNQQNVILIHSVIKQLCDEVIIFSTESYC